MSSEKSEDNYQEKMTKNDGERVKNGLNLKLNIKAAVRSGPGKRLPVGPSGLPVASALPLTVEPGTGRAVKADRVRNFFLPTSLITLKSSSKSSSNVNSESQETDEGILPGRVRRSSIICSTGGDKYTFDSETVELPVRSIDAYEKQLSLQSTASSTGSSGSVGQTLSKLSSYTEDSSDRASSSPVYERHKYDPMESTLSSSYSGSFNQSSSSPSSPAHNQQVSSTSTASGHTSLSPGLRCKRNSVVQSANLEPAKSVRINGRFQNPWDSWLPFRFTNILKFGLSKDNSNLPKKEQLDIVLPIVKPVLEERPPSEGVRVIWLGHSTVLVQFDGITVLTDPIFSDRASPSQVIGPKRFREIPCTVDELPNSLDAVVISHNHYDHLDLNTVTQLNNRFGTDLRWFAPLGLTEWFAKAGVDNVIELDWWEENCVPDKSDVSFVFTPAQHWSKRTLNDDNRSLWGGWMVIGPRYKFFFAGDTGFCPVFQDIGRLYGPITVSALPIGSFEPKWFMKHQHINPEEAVLVHQIIKSQFSVAVHWGTFALANEYYLDPPIKLKEALEKRNLSSDCFAIFKHGETRIVHSDGTSHIEKHGKRKVAYSEDSKPS